eukprot:3734424-Pleurochrysis_carterae.AAC.1
MTLVGTTKESIFEGRNDLGGYKEREHHLRPKRPCPNEESIIEGRNDKAGWPRECAGENDRESRRSDSVIDLATMREAALGQIAMAPHTQDCLIYRSANLIQGCPPLASPARDALLRGHVCKKIDDLLTTSLVGVDLAQDLTQLARRCVKMTQAACASAKGRSGKGEAGTA